VGSERVSIARVDGNAARVAGASTGSASDQRQVTRVGERVSAGGERVSLRQNELRRSS
jgi:hypothetical protein